ncbi:hypothetical protein [Aminobacter sp. BE322]|uniref:hypothetical protein n=1 Tax=unclassified Aminobacter TaxID=2644704 RepID=UPI003D1F17AE
MCDPLTIAGVALTGLSTGINYAAQAKVQRARDDAMAAERIRQNQLDQEAQALNVQSQDRYQDFQGQQDERSGQLGQFFTGQEVAEPTAAEALPASGSNITVREEAKQRGQAREFTDKTGTALGELRSFGDLLGEIGRAQAQDASLVGQIGGFKRGSSNVLPLELDEANRKGDSLKLFGDLAGGFGGLALNAGLSGGGMFGGGAKTANVAPKVSPSTYGAPGSRALGAALDRASVPGYAGYGTPKSSFYSFYGP